MHRTTAYLSLIATLVFLGAGARGIGQSFPDGESPVRGRVASQTVDVLKVDTKSGPTEVRLAKTLQVYVSMPSDLSHIKSDTFVGVSSAKQPDGSEQATEVHIFPEELRGVGEGSYPMNVDQHTAGSSNLMTNGSVLPNRMTNGAVTGTAGASTLTVQYAGGTQTIKVAPGVPVTILSPTKEALNPGQDVIVLARKLADGSLVSNSIILIGGAK